jgi:endonuclease YncB( thermonuclease family)
MSFWDYLYLRCCLPADPSVVPKILRQGTRLRAKVISVVDGDTLNCVYVADSTCCRPLFLQTSVRVLTIDTPEKSGAVSPEDRERRENRRRKLAEKKGVEYVEMKRREITPLEVKAGLAVKAFVAELIRQQNDFITIEIISADKFGGRVDGNVWIGDQSLAKILLDRKLAKYYVGDEKTPWTQDELTNILRELNVAVD